MEKYKKTDEKIRLGYELAKKNESAGACCIVPFHIVRNLRGKFNI